MVPVKPSDLLEAVVDDSDDMGEAITKTYVIFPVLFAKFLDYFIDEETGDPGPEFVADLCAMDCTGAASASTIMATLPFKPSDLKAAIPAPGGVICEKFVRSFKTPQYLYQLVSFIWNEDRSFTDEFKAAFCLALAGCQGTGTGGGGGTGLQPPTISASDGQFIGKVRITWAVVTGALTYDVYRNTVNDSSAATVIGNTADILFDDANVETGVTYYYWVKSKDGTTVSTFSNGDSGYASASLAAISDLFATQGSSELGGANVGLEFSPIVDADVYDFYRSQTNDFATATIIQGSQGRKPFDNSASQNFCFPTPCTDPIFLNNGATLAFFDTTITAIPQVDQKYYYWVVGRKMNGTVVVGTSSQSNTAIGWCIGDGSGVIPPSSGLAEFGFDYTVPSGIHRLRLYSIGNGGSGAGANGTQAGGGGGGGSVAWGDLIVTPGKKIRLTVDGGVAQLAGGASGVNGSDGRVVRVQYDGTGSFVDVIAHNPGTKGIFNGAGGTGGTVALNSTTNGGTKAGGNGDAANGTTGGRGGKFSVSHRPTPNHFGGNPGNTASSLGSKGRGGGGSSSTSIPSLATGGDAQQAAVVLIHGYAT